MLHCVRLLVANSARSWLLSVQLKPGFSTEKNRLLLLLLREQGLVIRNIGWCRLEIDVASKVTFNHRESSMDLAAVEENKAKACFHELLVYLEQQWNHSVQENIILQSPDFPGMKDYLVRNVSETNLVILGQDGPLSLAVILSECPKEEKKMLASASEKLGCGSSAVEQKWTELDDRVNELKREASEVKKEMKSLEVLYENHDYMQRTWQSEGRVEDIQKQMIVLWVWYEFILNFYVAVKEECLKQTNFIIQTKQMVLLKIVKILKQAEQLVAVLTDMELPEWKRMQQMACIGSPVDTCLNHLQAKFSVAEVLIQVRQQLQKLQDQNEKYNSTDASSLPGETEKFALSLVTKLFSNALVVEKRPVMLRIPQRPLILKTGVRFTAAVRFLANLPEFKCLLRVKPVFVKDVKETMTINGFRHFNFNRDNSKVLDVDVPGGGLVAEFAHMSLKENKARTKDPLQCHLGVTEELHIMKFVTGFQHNVLSCDIESFVLSNLLLFADPLPLTWQQLSEVLSWQFLSVGQRELDENQLSMLRGKIVDDPDGLIHWIQFSKNESAWIWIDRILDLITRHLVDLWRDGYIMGFVSRKTTHVLLQEKQSGTFLLRFSESNKEGAITFSWVEHFNGETRVRAVEPFTEKELLAMCLPDLICCCRLEAQGNETRNPLLYLYPDIPRDTAFGRCCSISALPLQLHRSSSLLSLTPSPSPLQDMHMGMDLDTITEDHQLTQYLFYDLLDLPSGPSLWTPTTQANVFNPGSPF
ncbi:signal transducer and activator of transcription 1-alpha/beta-like [Xiphias gladius]|uniref:signal transducer and activator of transcription 1-alpha/beta-like n=1 Tax=Xiphias gladius TaxID=8245 RepID=UPI001A99EC26|nr:signal transducer and activator of transcription 1-alpha/beta-like [Xiphias gladius]